MKKAGGKTIPGEELFRLYDTFGFPLDLARDIAMDQHLSLDETGFHREYLRGPEGSSVALTVQSPGEARRDLTLMRRRVTGGST